MKIIVYQLVQGRLSHQGNSRFWRQLLAVFPYSLNLSFKIELTIV